MESENLSKSIILLGPTAVGKSLFSKDIKEHTEAEMVLSTDRLYSFILMHINGLLNNIHLYKSYITQLVQRERIDRNRPDYEELKQQQLKDIDSYFEMLDQYTSLINFDKLSRVALENNKFLIFCSNNNLNKNLELYAKQLLRIRLLKTALEDINFPVLIDAGADIGVDYRLTQRENQILNFILQNLQIDISDCKPSFINCFGYKIYLKPGKDYFNRNDPRIHTPLNKIFLSNSSSYSRYANITVTIEKLYYKNFHPAFSKNVEFDVGADKDLKNNTNEQTRKKIIDEIIKAIQQLQMN